MTPFFSQKQYTTYGLISLNLIFFALEIINGGNENLNTLYFLGGLLPEDIWQGQAWRLLTANFLHFGWAHLLSNMIGLYYLGRLVESILGSFKYLFVYLVSGMGSMFTYSILAINRGDTEVLLVGASAAIMGLFGVILAINLYLWIQEKSSLIALRLRLLLLILLIQFTFDIANPSVSFLCHFFGLIIGFIIEFWWLLRRR